MDRHLILVRHSLPEIRKDLPAHQWMLSEEGKARAGRLADRLKSLEIKFLAASTEPKAKETAQIIAEKCGLNLQVFEGLHEHERTIPYLSKSEFEAAVGEFFENPDTLILGNETANQAYERFSSAINSILSVSDKGKIGIVSHGTVISLFASRLARQSGFQIWSELGLPGFVVLDMQSHEILSMENIP